MTAVLLEIAVLPENQELPGDRVSRPRAIVAGRDGPGWHGFAFEEFDVEAVDKHAVVSDRMMASTLIRRASLSPKERSQAGSNYGGILTPERWETVLRTLFAKLHDMEKRTGQEVPSTLRIRRQRFRRQSLLRQGNVSGMQVERLLEDEEMARTALRCHLSLDLLCMEMSDAW